MPTATDLLVPSGQVIAGDTVVSPLEPAPADVQPTAITIDDRTATLDGTGVSTALTDEHDERTPGTSSRSCV